ncbi:glycoside hydrolase family 35 protein [Hymenopellis radicata]|nr:glycoside hydrolase family 35 protein [Hymenopellis radicata]
MLRVFVKLLLIWQWVGAFAGSLARSQFGLADRAASYTDQVSFDSYSLSLLGRRIYLHSGEFHSFRLPVPDLWPDILQKFKAAGLNAVSVYVYMGLVNPSFEVVDWDGFRSLKALYDAAMEVGIWVYIQAESSAGGLPHWMTAEIAGQLRSNATDWTAAWKPYIHSFIEQTAPYQITEGGPVIDNEWIQDEAGHPEYYQELIDTLDSYPQLFDCSQPYKWNPVQTTYHASHLEINPSQPFYSPEFQGGAFDPWGPNAPGYDNCRILTGHDFMNVFYQGMWAMNAKLMNYYMMYGGTSWGALPYPGISENRVVGSKYDELKRQGYFIRSSADFVKTDWIGSTDTGLNLASTPDIHVTHLQNPDTEAGFYIVRHNDSTSTAQTSFQLKVNTSLGQLTLPSNTSTLVLNGRQSKTVVTDYAFGTSSTVLYSTASIYYAGTIGERDVILFYGDADQSHEFAMKFTGRSLEQHRTPSQLVITKFGDSDASLATLKGGHKTGLVTVHDSDTQLVLIADTQTASTFFSPAIPGDASNPYRNFWTYGTNVSILVGGPYLVRTADLQGSTLAITGDINSTTTFTVIAPDSVKSILWNEETVKTKASVSQRGGFTAQLAFDGGITVPKLAGWKYRDSLPEIQANYDDSAWVIANHTSTYVPAKPWYGDGRVLYGCDYGFCENIVLWRGHFENTGEQTSVNLSINGGQAFAATVWLNDAFLATAYGNSSNNLNVIEEVDQVFTFPEGALVDGDNVITIVQDNMGMNEHDWHTDNIKSPRGVRGFKLNNGTFSDWKVQGKVGGYKAYPDKVRGVLNEGGLFGERAGWHLPAFDTSSWASRELSDGLVDSKAGVGFFVTTFDLNIDGHDVAISFTFKENFGQSYRASIFVNGWMMGKRVANLGPQSKFPVHEGILNYHGTNTLAVALWALEDGYLISPNLQLEVDAVLQGGLKNVKVNNPTWTENGRIPSV